MLKAISNAFMGNKSSNSSTKETTKKKLTDDEIQKQSNVTNNLSIVGNKSSITTSTKGGSLKQKVPAVRRNSATTTVASSTTSASSSATNLTSSPNSPTVRRGVSQNQRPRGVADMEIKSHCEKIKRIIGTSRLSQVHSSISTSNIVLSSSDETVVYECFGNIVAIAQCSSSLEQGTLDDFLITCDALRRKQTKYANKITLLMSQAKASLEALVVPFDNDTHETSAVIQPSTDIVLLSQPPPPPSSPLLSHPVLSPPPPPPSPSTPSPLLSQHGKVSRTSEPSLQQILLQYDIARAVCAAAAVAAVESNRGQQTTTVQ